MTIRGIIGLALLGMLSTSHTNAATTLTEWGAVATISNATCMGDFCVPIGSPSVGPSAGGAGVASASIATGNWPTPSSALASGTVAGNLSVPLLTAGAASVTDSWIAGQALVMQGYDYTGTGSETLHLDWGITGNIVNTDSDPVTGLVVFVGFFGSDTLLFPDVSDPVNTIGLLAALAHEDPANNFLEFTQHGSVSHQGTLTIDVDNGSQFYLAMGLMAAAGGGGAMAESLSTLTASFNGNPSLVPAITAVPIPPALVMLLSALGAVFVSRARPASAIRKSGAPRSGH